MELNNHQSFLHKYFHPLHKDTYSGCTMKTDPSPHMDFHQMFGARFVARLLSMLTAAEAAMYFKLYGGFVHPYQNHH